MSGSEHLRAHERARALAATRRIVATHASADARAAVEKDADIRRHLADSSYAKWSERIAALIEMASAWHEQGEFDAVVRLYRDQVDTDEFGDLGLRERRLHHICFALMFDRREPGTPISFRYAAAALAAEFGDIAGPTAVKNSLGRLQDAGLIDILTGTRSPGRTKPTHVTVRHLLADHATGLDLSDEGLPTLSDSTRAALDGYATRARGERPVVRPQQPRVAPALDPAHHGQVPDPRDGVGVDSPLLDSIARAVAIAELRSDPELADLLSMSPSPATATDLLASGDAEPRSPDRLDDLVQVLGPASGQDQLLPSVDRQKDVAGGQRGHAPRPLTARSSRSSSPTTSVRLSARSARSRAVHAVRPSTVGCGWSRRSGLRSSRNPRTCRSLLVPSDLTAPSSSRASASRRARVSRRSASVCSSRFAARTSSAPRLWTSRRAETHCQVTGIVPVTVAHAVAGLGESVVRRRSSSVERSEPRYSAASASCSSRPLGVVMVLSLPPGCRLFSHGSEVEDARSRRAGCGWSGVTRRCGWCTHPGRDAWERRVLRGDSIRVVAAATPFSAASAQRHLRNHAHAAQLMAMRTSDAASLHVADFAARLVALGDEASAVGRLATDPRTRLLAIREEREALKLLMANLGIDQGEAVEVISEARDLAAAVSSLVGEWPRIGTELAARLRDAGAHDLALAFERVGINAQRRIENSPEVAS